MARTDPQFNLRVPIELKEKVEAAAKKSGRSINAEAVYRLEKGLQEEEQRRILYNEYHAETIHAAFEFLDDYFTRYHKYKLINVESLGASGQKYKSGSIRFWYSYPVDENNKEVL